MNAQWIADSALWVSKLVPEVNDDARIPFALMRVLFTRKWLLKRHV
ncbi:hypothetical protein [Vibrio parahaemolyticus]|nr:hypothetical protein [Vibrio parahaemolyticus]ELB2087660.1 hypothetical protein [Vibrio parahaemolyticus]MCF9123722.1 hypothetical protein [Vibrio parahaemolyticus]